MRIFCLGVVLVLACGGPVMAGPPDALLTLLAGRLAMTPDVRVMQALQPLTDEERPAGPVRVGSLRDTPTYADAADRVVRLLKPQVEAFVDHRVAPMVEGMPETIWVNEASPTYKEGGTRLSGLLAHEGLHTTDADGGEVPAYARQIEVLKRLGYDDEEVLAQLERTLALKKLDDGGG